MIPKRYLFSFKPRSLKSKLLPLTKIVTSELYLLMAYTKISKTLSVTCVAVSTYPTAAPEITTKFRWGLCC